MSLHEETLSRTVSASKILGSETRVRILHMLVGSEGDVCVNDIAKKIGLTHSATSHQLTKLHAQGVVLPSRKGQTMCYSLTDSDLAKDVVRFLTTLS